MIKQILLVCSVSSLLLSFDETTRLDTIVQEIENLRANYEYSQNELKQCRKQLINKQNKFEKTNNTKEKSLLKQIELLKKELKKKEDEIRHLKSKKVLKTKQKVCKSSKNKIESFPKLKMRKVVHVKAYPYRVRRDATAVYDAIDGVVVQKWEARRSFTSNIISADGQWIKITGYFTNGVWQPAREELWIRSKDAQKRERTQ